MTRRADRRSLRPSLVCGGVMILLAAGFFAGLSTPSFADEVPKPDPSGIATGDKTTAVDAAGNPFVVAEPIGQDFSRLPEEQERLRRLSRLKRLKNRSP